MMLKQLKSIIHTITLRLFPSKTAPCLICKHDSPIKETAYHRTFYECPNCSLIFTLDYDIYTIQKGMGMEGSWTGPGGGGFREYWLAAFLSKELELKSILLFGTGNTITFRRLKEEGYNVAGCDITPELVESRKKEFGDDSFFYPHMMPQDRRFDIIICVEVFEHFVEPRQSFNYLTSILSDNGIICGTTNFYLGGSIVDSNNPGYMSHIRHIIYWSKESLKNIAKQYNLETSCFEMISPGSVIPDEKFGQLWPNKRVFFLHKAIYNDFFSKLFLKNPILPIDKP